MHNFIRNTAVTGGMLAVMFMRIPASHALDTDLFLRASSSMFSDEVSSTSTPADKEAEGAAEVRESSTTGSRQESQPRKSPLSRLQALLGSLGMLDAPRSKDDDIITSADMASVHIAKVADTSVTLSWSSPKLTNVTVYYSDASPVLVSDETPSVSPWRIWSSKQVTIRGLAPDATYYYKVVAVTALGTTTSAEARFTTSAR